MHRITIQRITKNKLAPKASQLRQWAKQALHHPLATLTPRETTGKILEVTVRIVDEEEMTVLNEGFRHKKGPTNVLSFPCELPNSLKLKTLTLGDIVICAEVVNQEAQVQHKSLDAHWAHMVVHGILHLLGFDHEMTEAAEIMETAEINILKSMGFTNPYTVT